MPNFTAKEKYPAPPAVPGSKVPEADEDFLRELGATEFYPRKFEYAHDKHTVEDIIRPGYFTGELRQRLRVGDEIYYTARGGSKIPSEWARGILVVEENPNTREKPLIVAIIHRYKRATPVRHANTEDA